MKYIENGICAPKGFKAAGIHCGIRKNRSKSDLALILADVPCTAAAVYTQNKVKGSPILITKDHLKNGIARALIVNSGNANTCNADGEEKAIAMCRLTADACGIDERDVIVASTGVIGQPLPIEPIANGMEALAASLSYDGSHEAALAIMTTDLVVKECAVEFELDGIPCRIGGIAKGSGMIHPNMATMLGFITTDVAISPHLLSLALSSVTDDTFNMVSVDGDTSTNDMVSVMASGLAGNEKITEKSASYQIFCEALFEVCRTLSMEIARDGEGATKLLICKVSSAPDLHSARAIAKSVITSSLFKAAMFGQDANWGRILCAIGYADAEFDIGKVSVTLRSAAGELPVCENGAGIPFSEDFAKVVLAEKTIEILVELFSGESAAVAYGCDLTYDYVKINGDYRT